jgi:cytochrome bd-type quinol oxidase subunit 2
MRVHFKPTTDLGKWSARLIVTFAVLLGVFRILVASGQRGGDTFFSNPILTIPMLLAATSGIAAFITGLISVAKRRERSIAVYLAIIFGLFVILFALGEVIFPH